MFKEFFFLIFLILNQEEYLSDNICKKYENQKHLQFEFQVFKEAFNIKSESKNEKIIHHYDGEKNNHLKLIMAQYLNSYRFINFEIEGEGRRPIIDYNKELVEKRKNQIDKF